MMQNCEEYNQVQKPKKLSIPSIIFHKTPKKQRQNNPTALKNNTPIASNKLEDTPNRKASSPYTRFTKQVKQQDKENTQITYNNQNYNSRGNCINHPNKVAKFEAKDDNESYLYCEKCAIFLASKGFKVEKLEKQENEDPKSAKQRKMQVDQFKQSLNQCIKNINEKKFETMQIIQNHEEVIKTEVSKIDEYFESLHAVIEEQKAQYYNYVIQQKKSSESICTQFYDILEDCQLELEQIKQNLGGIKRPNNQTEEKKFKKILDFYTIKLNNYKGICRDWNLQELSMKPLEFKQINQVVKEIRGSLGLIDETIQSQEFEKKVVNPTSSSKKLKGMNTSIYFSFDAENQHQEVVMPVYSIPQQQNLIEQCINENSHQEQENLCSEE